MAMSTRPPESSDLDFTAEVTAPATEGSIESGDAITKLLQQSDVLIDSLQLQIALGCQDARVWKLLAAIFVGADRVADYDELATKHQAVFGAPLKLDLPAVTFSFPEKI